MAKDHSQRIFISNWNSIVSNLSSHGRYRKLPKLNSGVFSGGACAGFSFLLAEYIRLNKPERFFEIYNLVCDSKPKDLAKAFKLKADLRDLNLLLTKFKNDESEKANKRKDSIIQLIAKKRKELDKLKGFAHLTDKDYEEIIEFIYKVYILSEKQNKTQIDSDDANLSKEEKEKNEYLRTNISSENHQRIGNKLTGELGVDVEEITSDDNFSSKLKQGVDVLKNGESLEIGIFGTSGAHSILAYKKDDKYYIFDSSNYKKVEAATPKEVESSKEAAEEIIYSANFNETLGTNKYTPLDRLWKTSKVLTFLIFPISFALLIHDVFIAKPLSDDKLRSGPITKTVFLTWGKIIQPQYESSVIANDVGINKRLNPGRVKIDSREETITDEDLKAINNCYKNNRYSGLSWFKKNTTKVQEDISKANTDQGRYKSERVRGNETNVLLS